MKIVGRTLIAGVGLCALGWITILKTEEIQTPLDKLYSDESQRKFMFWQTDLQTVVHQAIGSSTYIVYGRRLPDIRKIAAAGIPITMFLAAICSVILGIREGRPPMAYWTVIIISSTGLSATIMWLNA